MKKAFTLVELLVVIAIIGVLSAIITPGLLNTRSRAKLAAAQRFDSIIFHAIGNKLIGEWMFDVPNAPAIDTSSFGYDGTATAAQYFATSGYNGKGAYSFDGATGRISIPVSTFPSGTNPSTFTLWIYPATVSENNIIMYYGNTSSGQARGVEVLANAHVRFFGYSSDCDSNLTVPVNSWSFIAAVYNGTNQFTYVNNKKGSTCSLSWNTTPNVGYIGCDIPSCPGGRNWNGLIDDVRIFSEALSASEIEEIYAEGIEKYGLAKR